MTPCGMRNEWCGCNVFGAGFAYGGERQEHRIVVTMGRPVKRASVIEEGEWVRGMRVSDHPMI